MRIVIVFLLLVLIQLLELHKPLLGQNRANSPNIVLIFMDDLGYGDVGAYGATGYATPNIDKFAAQGMRFTNFYTASPICSASRAALLTGSYPNRIGITGALFPDSDIGLNSKEVTIAE